MELINTLQDCYNELQTYYKDFTEDELEQIDTLAGKIQYFALEGEDFKGKVKNVDQELLTERIEVQNLIFKT